MRTEMAIKPVVVASALRPVLLRLARQLRRESHPLGVTGGQVALLGLIQQQPGIGVRGLATREGVSAPNISVQVRRLERAGLIERTPGTDRRRVGFTVTSDAIRVMRVVKSRRTAWLASRLARLDSADLAAIDAVILPLERLLDEIE